MTTSIEDLFQRVPLFRSLTASQRRALVGVLREEWFNPGDEIVGEGMPGGRMYVVAEGRAREAGLGRARRAIGPGQFIGDVSLFDGRPHATTVRAETPVKAYSLSSLSLQALLADNWDAARELIAALCRHVRTLEDSVAS